MTPGLQDLGRRAVACKGWRWMEGMVAASPDWPDHGWRLCWAEQVWDEAGEKPTGEWEAGGYNTTNGKAWAIANDGGDPMDLAGWFPDLSDPATLGCLLALVREAHGEPVWVWPDREEHGAWEWTLYGGLGVGGYASEAEALVAALEAANV